jgi:hypothetical protein
MTFSAYELTHFDVQYWNGTEWITVPGGSVANNRSVWRRFTFGAITTTKVRVLVTHALAGYARVVEIEVY